MRETAAKDTGTLEDTTGSTAVVDAPASTASAPASSAPASSTVSTPADRPTSFAEAMARVGDPAPPDPGSVPPPGAQPVAATAPPQTTTPPDTVASTDNTKGPIPFDRHESILKNARTKTEQETTQKLRQEYAPALEFADAFEADPISTLNGTLGQLLQQPQFAPAIKAMAARILGQRPAPQTPTATTAQPNEDVEPGPDLEATDERGNRVVFRSPENQAARDAWFQKRFEQSLETKLAPVLSREQKLAQQEKLEGAKTDASNRMSKLIGAFKDRPHFAAQKAAIAEKTEALLSEGHDPATALGLAYSMVLAEKVLPAHAAQSQQALVASAVAKSTGATSQPGTAPAAPAGRPTSMADGFSRIAM